MRIEQEPFPHAILDNASDVELVRAASAEWPSADSPAWHAVYGDAHQRKRACNRWEDFPPACRRLLAQMLFLDVSAFNRGPLVPDTGLWGGGMQEMTNGGVLARHLDASHHALSGLTRKLNAVLFLSEWSASWGGHLQLWDASGQHIVKAILPACNRLVLFACGDTTWHSVAPVACPPSTSRKSLACWWYGPPTGEEKRRRAHFAP